MAKKGFKAFWVLCLYRRRPEPAGFAPDGQVFAAFAVVSPALAAQPVSAVVVHAEPVVAAPVAPVGFVLEPVHGAFVAVAAVAEQLHVAAVAAAVAALVLRLLHLVAVVVAQVARHVQLALHLLHARLDVVRSADVVAPARYAAGHVAR